MPGDERPRPAEPTLRNAPDDEALLERLRTGELEPLGPLPRSSNATFLARIHGGVDGGGPGGRPADEPVLAVYKPRVGETPLWDFPEGTLCLREVAAYVLSRALGWPRVPPTVLRDGPFGEGAVQAFLPFDPARHYLTMREERAEEFRRVALFDVIANNADRKSGHCLEDEEGRLFVVDHGVCFHVEPKLRTVIWDFVGEPIPADARADLERLRGLLEGGPLVEDLGALLSPAELRALRRRVADLLAEGVFPGPGPGRPYPWPIV